MAPTTIHLFAGAFASRAEADAYLLRDWGDAPAEDAPLEEWQAWEAEYPKWPLREELGVYLDEDFVEFHFGSPAEAAERSLLLEEADAEQVRAVTEHSNVLVILDANALGGFEVHLQSTARLRYLGSFLAQWR
jgi:hypothetical protein